MTLPIPLTVRLSTARADRHIERDLRSLSFRSVVPGGFASAQFSLDRPLALSPDEIAYYGDVDIFDARNGECVWCGRLEDPGRGVGADGQIWDLAAVGPSAHARDRKFPYTPVYRDLAHWKTTAASDDRGDWGVAERNDDENQFLYQIPSGSGTWGAADQINATSFMIREAGMNLGRVNWQMIAFGGESISGGSTSWAMEGLVWPAGTTVRTTTFSGTGEPLSARVVGTHWTHPQDRLALRVRRISGTESFPSGTWRKVYFWNIRVRSTLYNKAGSEITSGASYTTDTVLASEIVADLLGRVLDQYDGTNASIATNSFPIEQLMYPDGVTSAEVLDDLMLIEPDHYWEATDRMPNGKYRFAWKQWPTTVRYEVEAVDGLDSPGSADSLYNRVRVGWRDSRDTKRWITRTQTVPQLTAAGLTREDVIELGNEMSGLSQAQRMGDQFLAEHLSPVNAGTLTVSRPIYDHDRGSSVMPWEIRPGHLIRVRGIQPSTDALNATGRDGVTVFKVVGVAYDTASASATLELDSQPKTVARLLARFSRPEWRRL